MAVAGEVRVEFPTTPEMLISAMVAQIDHEVYRQIINRDRRRATLRNLMLLPCWPFCGAGAAELAWRAGLVTEDHLLFGVVCGTLFGLARLIIGLQTSHYRSFRLAEFKKKAPSQLWPGFLGRTAVTVTEHGILYECQHNTATYGWPDVVELDVAPAGMSILLANGRSILIPNEASAGSTGIDEIRQAISTYWDPRRAAEARTSAFLAEHYLPCPSCEYELHGIKGDTCPECSRTVALDDLRLATSTPARAQGSAASPGSLTH
ncbi:MAG: hypothetical protein AAGH71_03660 [Planctomycetota bacterium]